MRTKRPLERDSYANAAWRYPVRDYDPSWMRRLFDWTEYGHFSFLAACRTLDLEGVRRNKTYYQSYNFSRNTIRQVVKQELRWPLFWLRISQTRVQKYMTVITWSLSVIISLEYRWIIILKCWWRLLLIVLVVSLSILIQSVMQPKYLTSWITGYATKFTGTKVLFDFLLEVLIAHYLYAYNLFYSES